MVWPCAAHSWAATSLDSALEPSPHSSRISSLCARHVPNQAGAPSNYERRRQAAGSRQAAELAAAARRRWQGGGRSEGPSRSEHLLRCEARSCEFQARRESGRMEEPVSATLAALMRSTRLKTCRMHLKNAERPRGVNRSSHTSMRRARPPSAFSAPGSHHSSGFAPRTTSALH